MPDPIVLNTDGPHSPEYTRDVGNALAEAVRVLNYATLGDAPGLDNPGDAYSLLGALYTALDRFPQLLDQVGRFLKTQAASGRIGDTGGRGAVIQAGMAAALLEDAGSRIGSASWQLHLAQNDITGLYVKESPDA
ncbi:MAG: hypothetical protein JWO67_6386 [Streptosporangiaceae bacterium]|nr:hypothetical protein [Streptosporangiaceae bacterium]